MEKTLIEVLAFHIDRMYYNASRGIIANTDHINLGYLAKEGRYADYWRYISNYQITDYPTCAREFRPAVPETLTPSIPA